MLVESLLSPYICRTSLKNVWHNHCFPIFSISSVQDPSEIKFTAKLPIRNHKGQLVFEGVPDFYPNMTPKEVLQAGSFGGTYFRPIKSGVTGEEEGVDVVFELNKRNHLYTCA